MAIQQSGHKALSKQRWSKLGLVFKPDRNYDWMQSHAANPLVEHRGGSLFRVYFSCRDADKRSHVGYVQISIDEPTRVLNISESPVLAPGEPGFFDDSGCTCSSLVRLPDGTRYMYYLGWNLATTVPWRNFIGLAVSEPGSEVFSKFRTVPIVDRSPEDPLTLTYPWVINESGSWHMWYGSNIGWSAGPHGKVLHLLKHATSDDGISWQRTSRADVLPQHPEDSVVARPTVIRTDDCYRMWYSHRGDSYRIGYAESRDGVSWERLDDLAGIEASANDWDSGSISYPCVFSHGGRLFMLYNGSGFGLTGFGIAVLE